MQAPDESTGAAMQALEAEMNGTGAVRAVPARRPQPREARTVVLPQPPPPSDRRGVAYGIAAFLCIAALGGAAGYAFLLRRGAFAADVVPIERASLAPRPAEPVAEPATPQVQAAEHPPSAAPAAATDAGAAPDAPPVIAQAAPAVAPAAVPPAPVPPAPPVPPAAESPQIVKPKRTVPPAAPQPAVPVITAKGELVLLIRPWARVEVDGQEVGVTPLNEPLMLAAGEHTVRLVNPDLGKDITRTVRITASGREVLKELLDE